jgi:serine/threonine protein kinase
MAAFCVDPDVFELGEVLGAGGEGMVVACRLRPNAVPNHPRPDTNYALKIPFNFGQSTITAKNSMANEHFHLATLPYHPNVVQCLCSFFTEVTDQVRDKMPVDVRDLAVVAPARGRQERRVKAQFFVLERLTADLKSYLARLPAEDVVPRACLRDILLPLGRALRHLEDNGVVHLDLKTNNVLVDFDSTGGSSPPGTGLSPLQRCVLSDLGLAKLVRADAAGRRRHDEVVSAEGYLLSPWGNAPHIAPELHNAFAVARAEAASRSRPTTFSADYARQPTFEFGVLAYEVLTGDHPLLDFPAAFQRGSRLIAYSDTNVASLADIEDNYPAGLSPLLRSAVAFDPTTRPSLRDFVAALEALDW